MKRFLIEREIPQVGTRDCEQLQAAAKQSNDVLRQLGSDIQWIESFVADDKMFCIYLATEQAVIQRHAEMSGFPATKITEIKNRFDPTTERG